MKRVLLVLCILNLSIRLAMTPVCAVTASNHPSVNVRNKQKVNDAMVQAAQSGDFGRVKNLLTKGADVNGKGLMLNAANVYSTPLIEAAKSGNTELAQYLIHHGAKINAQGTSSIGNYGKGDTALMCAAAVAQIRMMRLLIRNGANLRIKNEWGQNAMTKAMDACSIPAIKLLRRAGMSVRDLPAQKGMRFAIDSTGQYTSEKTVFKVFKYLLDIGANPNARGFQDMGDTNTVLMIACGAAHGREGSWDSCPAVARLLLERGANPNLTNTEGETALACAASTQDPKMFKVVGLLLAHGAKVNARQADGSTALIQAAQSSSDNALSVQDAPALLSHGADTRIRDENGKTALDYARSNGSKSLVRLLEHHNARREHRRAR